MNITVFCGSALGKNKHYKLEAEELAHWIGENNHRLVYGGSAEGIMGAVAKVVLSYDSPVMGVLPDVLKETEPAFEEADELIFVNGMSERKDILFKEGDIFVALFGGPGTLEEIADVISWLRIGIHNKPVLIYNNEGYYNSLKQQYEKMIEEAFVPEDFMQDIYFIDNMADIIKKLEEYSQTIK